MTSIRGILPAPLASDDARLDKSKDPRLRSPRPQAPQPAHQRERYLATLRQVSHASGMATPTRNAHLAFRRGGFASLCEALDYAALGATGFNFFDARGTLQSVLSYARLQAEAKSFARRLIGAAIGRGERLVIIADTWPGFCIAFMGAQYAGVIAVPVSVPVGLGARASYVDQLRRQIAAAGAVAILAPDELAGFAREAAAGTTARLCGTLDDFARLPEAIAPLRPFGRGEPCYVQFSSGSTRAPRGIDIRQDQLMANIDGSLAAQQLSANDAGVSWLPLYHDMGLIGFMLAPLCAQRSIDLMAPRDFARRPLQWLSLISRRRATITYSPTFGYELAARRARTQDLADLDLGCLRLAGVGADMIQPSVLERFAMTFAGAGFDRRAFLASYGLAEVCVGLSFGELLGGIRVDSFADAATGRTRDFVLCGRPMAGHRGEIRDGSGHVLGERQIGRIFVQGPSVMPGHFPPAANDAELLRDGWLDTGDLGYWQAGELVITGRAKDLIIVNGRNIWPQDIEGAVEGLAQMRRGDACAFSVEGEETEAVVVLVQGRPHDEDARTLLEGEIRQTVRESIGIDSRVVLISRQPGLPLTSSGKLSRTAARNLYLEGGYDHKWPVSTIV